MAQEKAKQEAAKAAQDPNSKVDYYLQYQKVLTMLLQTLNDLISFGAENESNSD